MEPVLITDDLPATVKFYVDTLGLRFGTAIYADAPQTFVPNPDPADPRQLIFAMFRTATEKADKVIYQTRGAVEAKVGALRGAKPGGAAIFYVRVPDVKALYEKLQSSVEIVAEPTSTWKEGAYTEFAIRDPNGYIVAFTQDVTRPQASGDAKKRD